MRSPFLITTMSVCSRARAGIAKRISATLRNRARRFMGSPFLRGLLSHSCGTLIGKWYFARRAKALPVPGGRLAFFVDIVERLGNRCVQSILVMKKGAVTRCGQGQDQSVDNSLHSAHDLYAGGAAESNLVKSEC